MARSSSQGLNRLSAAAVKTIAKPGWHSDGGGLYLEVDVNGRKRWAMRLTVNGKRRDFGLGPIHKVSLQEAREAAVEYRSKAYRGVDPAADRRAAKSGEKIEQPTFATIAQQVHLQRRGVWRNGKHVDQWINTLRDNVFPIMGDKSIADVGTADIVKVLAPIWTAKPETARRVRQRISTVLDWARAAGLRSGDNPVELIGDALPRQRRDTHHHAALPYADVPSFIANLRTSEATLITKLAFEFLILTAARTIEVRKALWSEIDVASRTWTIPGDNETTGRRMKSGRDHVVPLSSRALVILSNARSLAFQSDLIFPDDATRRAMSENRFLSVRDALGYKDTCTPHGFRSSFRDWAAEETSFPAEVVEMALAHAIKSKTEAAYRRGHLLAKRFELMEAWAQHATAGLVAP
jgi:integrase